MKEKVGLHALSALLFVGIVSRLAYLDAHSLSQDPGNSAWMLPLLGGLLSALLLGAMLYVMDRSGDLTLAMSKCFGKTVGGLLLAVILLGMLYELADMTAQSASQMRMHLYSDTEDRYFIIVFGIAMLCIAMMGVNGVVRVARFAAAMLGASLVITLLMNLKNLEAYRLFPLLGGGVEKIAVNGLRFSETYYPIFAVLLFGPFMGKGPKSGKAAYKALGLGMAALTVTVLCMSMTLSTNNYVHVASPLYYVMSLIDAGRFFDMVDPLLLFGWLSGIAVSGAFLLCAVSTVINRFFGWKRYRITCIITTVAALAAALMIDEQTLPLHALFRDYGWALLYAPVVLLFIANIGRKRNENP